MYGLKINYRPLLKNKTGDNTMYILGTGESVNEYTKSDWERIRQGYSVGLNMWVFHDFIPNILQLELLSENDSYLENLIQIFERRQKEYANTKFFFKSNYLLQWRYKNIHKFFRQMPKSLKENIYLIADFQVPGSDLSEFTRSVRWLDAIGFFQAKHKFHPFTAQPRASLGLAVLFSIQAGFKHIALCGVDLNNDDHFYDNTDYYFDKYDIKYTRSPKKISMHLTNDENFSQLTISRVLMILYQEVCKPRGIQMSVGSRNSALFPLLPYTFINKFDANLKAI